MCTRKSDHESFWLRVSEWLRVSAWVPPGLAIAWLATLATLVQNTGIMLAAWGTTVSLVLLIILLARQHAARRHQPDASAPGKAPSAGAISTEPSRNTETAPDQPGTPSALHATGPDGRDVAGHSDAVSSTKPNGATMHPIAGEGQPLTGGANPVLPDLRILTAEEVASALRVDLALVINSLTNGELPGNQIGSHWRIDHGALVQWLQGSYRDAARKDSSR